ncbi:MAG TPA: acyltransferase domain-containing protein [Chthoniobacteraceae bacterium]|nr:acyltransferase domain-containing protein [Chthoniobacteraceae bacterium]
MKTEALPQAAWGEADFAREVGRCGLRPDTFETLIESHRTIARSPGLRLLAQTTCATLFGREEVPPPALPRVAPALKLESGLLHAVALLFRLPRLRSEHARRGIPEAVTRATLEDLERWMDAFAEANGKPGLSEAAWLARHFQGRLLAVGRLQFEWTLFKLPYRVFRHGDDGTPLVMATSGMDCDARGWPADSAPAWQSVLREGDDGWEGHPVDPDKGCLRREPTFLSRDEWQPVLAPGDRVLAVHIPKGGRLPPEAVADSFRDAARLFPQWFPEHRLHAMTCASWMLDPQLKDHLPHGSNLLAFQRHFLPVPIPGATDEQLFERVLGGQRTLPENATSLQRAVLEHVRCGGAWRMGGGIRLPDAPF